MFMEAVIQSLKDMEIKNPQAEQLPAINVGTVSVEPSHKDDSNASSQHISGPKEREPSLVKHSTESKSKTISTASEECIPIKAESNSVSAIHPQNLASPGPSLSLEAAPTLLPPPQPTPDTSSVTESSNASGSARSDSSASVQSSSDTDISHNTKATVTVVRNPAGHVMDGLMRRWDFNFFRNSNNR